MTASVVAEAPYIVLDPCDTHSGHDEYDNWCERGMSSKPCVRCGQKPRRSRSRGGWFIGPAGGQDDFYCDRCVTTHYPEGA